MTYPDWLNVEGWGDYLDMRINKKPSKPLSERGERAAIRRLDKHRQQGHDPNDLVDRSTVNQWLDFFPEDKKDGSDFQPF